MKQLKVFRFLGFTLGIYLGLFLLELLALSPLLDIWGKDFRLRILIWNILLLIVDPLLTWFLTKRFDFRKTKENEAL